MHKNSRFYLAVSTATDYIPYLRKLISNYSVKINKIYLLEVKSFVEDSIEYYLELNKKAFNSAND